MAKIDDSVKKKVPELRFAGFADDWEQRKFDECFNFPVSTNSLSRALLNYDEGDIQSVHYGDILIKYPAILNVKNDKIPYITDSSFEKYKSNLLENGDLIFADAAEDETVGKAVEVNGLTEENLVAGLHTIVARSKDKKAEFFLGYYINSNTYHRQLLRLIQGSKVSSISKGNLQKTLVSFPKDFEEQQKIGAFFKQLDETIALHQRKLDLLKEQKKGYLQKMFPKNGAKVPELRFAGFADDWEERKLGELGSVAMNRRIFKDQTSENEEVPFFKIGTFGSKPDAFISRELFEEYKLRYPYPEIGDILISASGSIGRTVVYQGEDEYFQDSNIVWLKHNDRLDNKFLKQFYSIVKWQGLEGSTIKRLYNKNILDTDISIPSTIEQNKIGMFFEQLDDTIALHQRKLDLLKEQKKGFLQKMFV